MCALKITENMRLTVEINDSESIMMMMMMERENAAVSIRAPTK